MKNLFFFTLFSFIAFTSIAQSKLPLVGVTREEMDGDTIRTFSLLNTDHDKSIQKLLAVWGEPVKQTPGNITWQRLTIPDVGSNLTVELYDGVLMTLASKGMMFKIFKDKNDKAERLRNLPSGDNRVTDIIIFNSDRKMIITTQPLEDKVVKFLEAQLKEN